MGGQTKVDEDRKPPYRCWMHYDSTVQGVWIGFGVDLHPACGQSEYIGVTGMAEAVDCKKCLHIMDSPRRRR
jgi:hypothetical protein